MSNPGTRGGWPLPAALSAEFVDELQAVARTARFDSLGAPVSAACANALLELAKAVLNDPGARRSEATARDLFNLLVLANESKFLARHGLPHFSFDYLRAYRNSLENGPPETRPKRSAATHPIEFFGQSLRTSIGVGSSVLTATPSYVKYFFDLGYGSVVYKTVRSRATDEYRDPTWAFVSEADLPANRNFVPDAIYADISTLPKTLLQSSTVNSFGVPSPAPKQWMADFDLARKSAGPDQVLIASVMGSVDHFGEGKFVKDFGDVSRLAKEAGATAIELNLSCPNVVDPHARGLLCERPKDVERVVNEVRDQVGSEVKLILKLSMLPETSLADIVRRVGGQFDGISGINTMKVQVLDRQNKPFFPGSAERPKSRLYAGLSGFAIRNFGLKFVSSLQRIREHSGHDFKIVGIGGVLSGGDFDQYRASGADLVQSVTGVFINPFLVDECR